MPNQTTQASGRLAVFSSSPFEAAVGFSRATRVGPWIAVAGTAPIADDGSTFAPGDAFAQAERCFRIGLDAVEKAGGRVEDVFRTRIYLTDAAVWEEVGRAHAQALGHVRPAATMLVVAKLLRDDWSVEIELDAWATSVAEAED